MSEVEKQICRILRRRFHCLCGMKLTYCACVVELVNLMLEMCEEEVR